jgi:hypothetical protein
VRDKVRGLNALQKFLVEGTRLGIPALAHEECMPGLMAKGATLFPAGIEHTEFFACIVCGTRGWADALANVLLFAPLGAALVAARRTGARPIAYGCALSCAVELAQTVIPGRDPSFGDVCFNTLGTAMGQPHFVAVGDLTRAAPRVFRPPPP